jgi:hypothetical protein
MNKIWQAIAHEASLAAEHIGIGATAIGKANYADAYYAQAFFALTTGFERASKLYSEIQLHMNTNFSGVEII